MWFQLGGSNPLAFDRGRPINRATGSIVTRGPSKGSSLSVSVRQSSAAKLAKLFDTHTAHVSGEFFAVGLKEKKGGVGLN